MDNQNMLTQPLIEWQYNLKFWSYKRQHGEQKLQIRSAALLRSLTGLWRHGGNQAEQHVMILFRLCWGISSIFCHSVDLLCQKFFVIFVVVQKKLVQKTGWFWHSSSSKSVFFLSKLGTRFGPHIGSSPGDSKPTDEAPDQSLWSQEVLPPYSHKKYYPWVISFSGFPLVVSQIPRKMTVSRPRVFLNGLDGQILHHICFYQHLTSWLDFLGIQSWPTSCIYKMVVLFGFI